MHNDPLEITIPVSGHNSSRSFHVLPYKNRVFNRLELADELKLTNDTSDDETLFAGYKKHGNRFFNKVNGSFIFIHLDNNKLVIASGCECTDTLFYWINRNSIVVSQRLGRLLTFPGVPNDLNIQQLASILSCIPLQPSETCYRHIKRLPPGHLLSFNGAKLNVDPYWKFGDIEKVHYKNDADYLENFLNLYSTSVKNRLDGSGKTGISLSGGLDSGTVAVLAARELAKENRQLYSYTSTPLYDSSPFLAAHKFDDESGYVRLLCRQYPNIVSKFLNAKDFSPLDGMIKTLDVLNQPLFAVANMFSLHNLRLHASMDHIDTWLIGHGGNVTISFSGNENHSNGLADLIRNFEYLRLFYGEDSSRMLFRAMIPEMLMKIIRKFRRPPVRLSADWRNFSAINPAFANKLDISDIQPFADDAMIFKDFQRAKFENYFCGIGADFHSSAYSEYGLRTLDPTRDRKLLEFCFGIPDDQYCRYGIPRFLVRRAFNGKMPEAILWNKARGRQAADIVLRIKAESQRIENIMDKLNKSSAACEILDMPKIADVLVRIQTEKNPDTTLLAGNILLRGIMVGLFLLRHEGDKSLY